MSAPLTRVEMGPAAMAIEVRFGGKVVASFPMPTLPSGPIDVQVNLVHRDRAEEIGNRAEMANRLLWHGNSREHKGAVFAAAAEFSKACEGCTHWGSRYPKICGYGQLMPADGSGYCSPGFEPREAK